MAFWDKVKEVSAKGLDKAKDLGEQAKLNVQKEREQAKIKAAYGNQYWRYINWETTSNTAYTSEEYEALAKKAY